MWNCVCDCGNKTTVRAPSLRSGNTSSCGCGMMDARAETGRKNSKDITGNRYGRLVVIRRDGHAGKHAPAWLCQCDCGKTTRVQTGHLSSGHTKSCGCLNPEVVSKMFYKHGKSKCSKFQYARVRERIKDDPVFAVKHRYAMLVANAIYSRGYKKKSRTHQIVGCTYEELHRHIERQFHGGMSWDRFSDIHIDHIVPLASAKTVDEVVALNHFTNLRPTWAIDNLKKGARREFLI